MPRIYPIVEEEKERKYRGACPRLKKWRNRVEEAEGDVNRMRVQAINRSPIFVAIQRGSRNINVRTKTTVKLWRMWIQQGKRVDDEDIIIVPQQISQAMLQKQQRSVSISSLKSPQRTPRKTVPVTPLKTPKKSPVKVSVLRAQTDSYVGERVYSSKYNVPMVTLTPVPLNKILRKKAKIIGQISSLGKGRWINQDSSRLMVPGGEVFGYETGSETEDETERTRREKVINMMKHTPTPTETVKKKLETIRRRDSQMTLEESPSKGRRESIKTSQSPPKRKDSITSSTKSQSSGKSPPQSIKSKSSTPTKSPPKSPSGSVKSKESRESLKKMKAAGHVSAMIGRHESPEPDDTGQETEEEPGKQFSDEYWESREPLSKEDAIRKIRAVGQLSATLSPRKDAPDLSLQPPTEAEETEDTETEGYTSTRHPTMKTVAQASIIVSPSKKSQQQSEQRNEVQQETEPETEYETEFEEADDLVKPSGFTSLMLKMRFLTKISPKRKKLQREESTTMGSLMTKLRFLSKLLPRKRAKGVSQESEESKEGPIKGFLPMSLLMTKIGFLTKIREKKKKPSKDEEEVKEGETSVKEDKDKEKGEDKEKADASSETKQAKEEEPKKSKIKALCPCIFKKKEAELMEFHSGSQVEAF